jgi:hypothetical protein
LDQAIVDAQGMIVRPDMKNRLSRFGVEKRQVRFVSIAGVIDKV